MNSSPSPSARVDCQTAVAVIGGGIAGLWTAYQLAKAGVDTTLVSYEGSERGGMKGSSRQSAGAFNLSVLGMEGLEAWLQDLGRGQTHPSVARAFSNHFPAALEEFETMVKLKPVKIGKALAVGNGDGLLKQLQTKFCALGGKVIDGWVTRLVADATGCRGLQYENAGGMGKLRCRAMVLASGGYAGLFANSMKVNCFGTVLGQYLQCGGIASNLEFLFKHGYGNVDANALTPTEELPGAEIYDSRQQRVQWLEQLLFHQQGTRSHLQAVQFWLRNPETEFFVDLSYRPLYLKLRALNSVLNNPAAVAGSPDAAETRALDEVVELFPAESRLTVRDRILGWMSGREGIGYSMFEELKPFFKSSGRSKFRVAPMTYFSMGGAGHIDFRTNLKNVFVTGEVMHDFGANRVGGLPWSLYLASGRMIASQVTSTLAANGTGHEDFEMVLKPSRFDPELLREVQRRLYEVQDKELTAARATECVDWMRQARERLREEKGFLHDGVSWLIVAEAVLQCSLCRRESRGFFFRFDYQPEDEKLENLHSCAWYDAASDTVSAHLMPWEQIAARVRSGVAGKEAGVPRE